MCPYVPATKASTILGEIDDFILVNFGRNNSVNLKSERIRENIRFKWYVVWETS